MHGATLPLFFFFWLSGSGSIWYEGLSPAFNPQSSISPHCIGCLDLPVGCFIIISIWTHWLSCLPSLFFIAITPIHLATLFHLHINYYKSATPRWCSRLSILFWYYYYYYYKCWYCWEVKASLRKPKRFSGSSRTRTRVRAHDCFALFDLERSSHSATGRTPPASYNIRTSMKGLCHKTFNGKNASCNNF